MRQPVLIRNENIFEFNVCVLDQAEGELVLHLRDGQAWRALGD